MARKPKVGLDYFPLDTVLDTKIELIEAEFGLTGFAVVVKLFQKIYGEQGYYCEWTDEVALLFSRKCGEGCTAVSEIVKASIKRGIFNKDIYEKYHILTSKGIQERFLEAVNRRNNIEVKSAYLLVSDTEILENVNINEENVYINGENVNINSQSKVKEIKVKENRVKSMEKVTRFFPPTLEDVQAYCKERNNNINAERFIDYYTANGWIVGKSKMKDWKAAIRTWENNSSSRYSESHQKQKDELPSNIRNSRFRNCDENSFKFVSKAEKENIDKIMKMYKKGEI